jgi:hypothetical protein
MSLEFQNVLVIMSVHFLQQKYLPFRNIQTPLSSETDLTSTLHVLQLDVFNQCLLYAAFIVRGNNPQIIAKKYHQGYSSRADALQLPSLCAGRQG